jgi:hypothetical protein
MGIEKAVVHVTQIEADLVVDNGRQWEFHKYINKNHATEVVARFTVSNCFGYEEVNEEAVKG